MCGIVGYVGDRDCADVLVDALSKLEYRGYDSAGIAVFEKGTIKVEKCKGRLANLVDKMAVDGKLQGHCGIGHTRWATHGEPSDINSHPHGNKRVSIVHNGIIENYKQIKDFLVEEGYSFVSETDTETVAKLLDYYYVDDPVDTIIKVLSEIKGSYALGIMFRDYPDTVFAVRKESPLIVGVGENENFLASDVPAIIKYTRDYYLLEANEIAVVKKDSVQIYDMHKEPVHKEINTADWDVDAAEKGGYEHFMLKEIHEQPAAVRDTVSPRIINGMPDLSQDGVDMQKLKDYRQIFIVACGTAMHAGMVGKYVIEKLARKPVIVDIASEFRYRDPIITKDDLMIVISQSGETADTMAVLRLAKEVGAATLAVVNVVGSSIAREADMVADLRAATPSHAAQLLWPERQWYAQLVDDLEANLLEAAERRLSQADQRLDTLGRALTWLSPERGLARLEERFGTLARRLDFALEQKLERTDARLRFLEAGMSRYAESRVLDTRLEQTAALTRRLRQAQALQLEQIGGRLDTASSRLEERFARQFEGLERQLERYDLRLRGLDPEGPLERGYAYAFTADGHFVRSIRDVQPGASLTVKIRDGEADTRVTAVRATGESHDIP